MKAVRHFAKLCLVCCGLIGSTLAMAQTHQAPQVKSLRLYVFDCGTLKITDIARYHLTAQEIATSNMSVPCFLIAHPKGTLVWDVGVIPDSSFKPGPLGKVDAPVTVEYATSVASTSKPLLPQMAAAGYTPVDITYLALSHFHYDHVANANAFASSTWLVRQKERDIMFAQPTSPRTVLAFFDKLQTSETLIVKENDYDVFGDGSVVMKSAPGHSPDHQVLFLKLPKTGPVLLSGDLYHYPEERKLNRLPTTEFNVEQTAAARANIEAFIKNTGAQLWIQHDFTGYGKLKKAPLYYE